MEQDANIKRVTFISRSVEIRETFKFASPVEVVSTMKVYQPASMAACSGI
jgi:hypothetical protein